MRWVGRDRTRGGSMTPAFDKDYWESHWQQADGPASGRVVPPNPYLARQIGSLTAGTALDAGCARGGSNLDCLPRRPGTSPQPRSPPRPCPRLRARDGELCSTRARAMDRGRPECLGTGQAVRPGHDPLRPSRNAATGVLRAHLRLGGTRRHSAHRRAPSHLGNAGAWAQPGTAGSRGQSARRGVGHRGEHHKGTRRHPVGHRHRRRAHPHPDRRRRPDRPVERRRRARHPPPPTHGSGETSAANGAEWRCTSTGSLYTECGDRTCCGASECWRRPGPGAKMAG